MKKLVVGSIVATTTIMMLIYSIPVYANHTEVGPSGDCSAPQATLSGSDGTSVKIVGPLDANDPRDNFDRNANGYICVGQVLQGKNILAVIHFDDK